jgi:hypothetical protein
VPAEVQPAASIATAGAIAVRNRVLKVVLNVFPTRNEKPQARWMDSYHGPHHTSRRRVSATVRWAATWQPGSIA